MNQKPHEPEGPTGGLETEIIEIEDQLNEERRKHNNRRKKAMGKEETQKEGHEKNNGVPAVSAPTTQSSSVKGSAFKPKTRGKFFSEDLGAEKKSTHHEKAGPDSFQPIVHCDFKEDQMVKLQVALMRQLELGKKRKKGLSKYDLIKVTVLIEGRHRYVLSRFLISKMLCVCNFKHQDALSIAKEVKKRLIENNELDITQERLEEVLYENMYQLGYDSFIQRYKMVNKFYQQRIPLIILIAGTKCIGKSFIATTLAERMNISNVLSTSIIEKVMQCLEIKNTEIENDSMEAKFEQKCRLLRRGASTDINKCLTEGKPLVIEGDIVPNLYIKKSPKEELKDEESKELDLPNEIGTAKWDEAPLTQAQISKHIIRYISDQTKLKGEKNMNAHEMFTKFNSRQSLTQLFKVVNPELEKTSEQESEKKRERDLREELGKLDQGSVCILPILLISNKSGIRGFSQSYLAKHQKPITRDGRLKKYDRTTEEALKIQNYLLSKYSSYFWITPVIHGQIEQTINLVHDLILKKIEHHEKTSS